MTSHYDRIAETRGLLTCGALAGPLFVVAFLIEGATRPNYDPLRHPVSSLSLGESGWAQRTNFVVTGLLTLAFSLGLRRTFQRPGSSASGSFLVGSVGVGLIGAGIFATDPVGGYPPGTPDRRVSFTARGLLHDLSSTPFFFGLPAACFAFARQFLKVRETGWAIYSIASGLAVLIAFFLAGMGFSQARGFVRYGGLFQRVSIAAGFGWLTALAVHLSRALNSQTR